MKKLYTTICLSIATATFSQNEINWDGQYQLQLSDFQSPATQIGNVNVYSLHTGSGIDFSFYMSNVEFMFTKNFNSKVNNAFKRDVASLVSPDETTANSIISFAQYEFDLSELYARKFRKKLFEEKGAFSNVSFFKPIYDAIQKEFSERDTEAGKATDLGRKKEKLQVVHEQVLKEVQELFDFCKDCKPPKKQK
jgi:hypothetical protein